MVAMHWCGMQRVGGWFGACSHVSVPHTDAVCLDREWRTCSGLVGALPGQPRQNVQLGLPLKLSPEEATLLMEKGDS